MSGKNKALGKKTVVAIGKFDGVHTGHKKLLDTASGIAAEAGLESVCLVIAPKGGRYLLDLAGREEYIKDIGINSVYMQDLSAEFMSMSAEKFVGEYLVKKLNCAHVVVGYNFRFAKGRCANADDLKRICGKENIQCTVIPEVNCIIDGENLSVSSSNIRSFLQNGRVDVAAALLGRSYFLRGKVVLGKQLGRTIDFPTANVDAFPGTVIPQKGVYATYTHIDGVAYLSVTNIGDNPTVNTKGNITVESNIFDFSQDIYGREVCIEFLAKVRDEIKFSSVEKLREQIRRDKDYVSENYNINNI